MKTASPRKAAAQAGHVAHTQDAETRALPGRFQRPIKVTFLGAGSFFTPRLLNDVLLTPQNQGGTLALVDVDESRLKLSVRMMRELIKRNAGGARWKLIASTDRREILGGSDYVINSIEVNGPECVETDNDIPLKYGIDQCIGDTIGPGGLFKGLRTIPVFLDILRDCERLCPQALVLNYTNPMAMVCMAAARASSMPVVGLCHSVQGTSHLLAKYAEVPYEEMRWECAGINHLSWFTRLEHRGQDLYPRLRKKFAEQIERSLSELAAGKVPKNYLSTFAGMAPEGRPEHHLDLVRKQMCLEFGAFITESSGHLSEYLPYFRKNEEGRRFLRSGYEGGSRFYATNWPEWRKGQDEQRRKILAGLEPVEWNRSWEYASWIIEAIEKNAPFRMHGNVINGPEGKLITNLPEEACVEVACLVDGNGVQPTRYGALPKPMAALCQSNLAMFDSAAEACIHRSREAAVHALLLDPLSSAVCSTTQIRAMAQEMFQAQKRFLPGFR